MAGKYVEELVAFLGWEVDSKELDGFGKQVADVAKTVAKIGVAVSGAISATAAFVTLTNRATTENKALADAVGVSVSEIEALAGVLRPAGFQYENVIDLVEEMNNKIGESTGLNEPISAVADATKILGLEFSKLKQLKPEDQFYAVIDAAMQLEDQQKAVSAVDMMMGGEANKILGYLRSQNSELAELLDNQLKLNFLSDEGRQGALDFTNTLNNTRTAVFSMGQELAGLAGSGLSEVLGGINEWIKNNRELIKSEISKWADRITRAIQWLWKWMKELIVGIDKAVTSLGGFENVVKLIGIALGSMIAARTLIMIAKLASEMRKAGIAAGLMNAGIALTPLLIAGIIALLALIGEDLYQFFTGGESLFGELGDKIAEFAHMNVRPFIASLLGMTPEELDLAMVKVVSSVTNFFTKTIPDIWQKGVGITEDIITWSVENIGAILENVYNSYLDVFTRVKDFVTGIARTMYNTIVENFDKAIAKVKGALNAIPGLDKVLDLNTTVAPSTAGLGATTGARAVASSITNSVQRSSAVNVSSPITINQQPGQSGPDLARAVADELGRAVNRAAKRADSGREI